MSRFNQKKKEYVDPALGRINRRLKVGTRFGRSDTFVLAKVSNFPGAMYHFGKYNSGGLLWTPCMGKHYPHYTWYQFIVDIIPASEIGKKEWEYLFPYSYVCRNCQRLNDLEWRKVFHGAIMPYYHK